MRDTQSFPSAKELQTPPWKEKLRHQARPGAPGDGRNHARLVKIKI